MNKFFRRIRQKMLTQNKFSKYLLYAIGEILLVVIGILIALQINIRNEQIKQNKIEQQYLERLVTDLATDYNYYERRIGEIEFEIEQLDQYVHEAYETQENTEDVKQLFGHLYVNTDDLTTQNSTYKELTSTGKINVFRDKIIKTSIIDYYRIADELAAHIKEFNLVSTEYLVESARVVRNWQKFHPGFSSLYNDPKMLLDGEWDFINNPSSEKFQALEFMASIYHLRNTEHLDHFSRLKSLSSVLANQIEESLPKKDR